MGSKIVVVGSSNTDMIAQVDRIPAPGETVIGGTFSTAAGGKGANQAVAAARAGGEVTFLCKVGTDMFGDEAVAGFRQDGIDVTHVLRDNGAPTGVALIFVGSNGENSIAVASGANANLLPDDVVAAADVIRSADILLLQLEVPMETVLAAATLAHEHGVKVILNPAPAFPLADALLSCVTVLTPNETEAGMLAGIGVETVEDAERAGELLLAKGIPQVLVTMGSDGVCATSADGAQRIPAFPVEPVDTTAAGDTFNGALAVALAEGKSLDEAIVFANGAGALSVTRLGAQPSAPTREEISAFLRKHNR